MWSSHQRRRKTYICQHELCKALALHSLSAHGDSRHMDNISPSGKQLDFHSIQFVVGTIFRDGIWSPAWVGI